MRTIGRHGKDATQRQVLDTLSFEIRAAFFECYDLAWRNLLDAINKKAPLSDVALRFHKLWHFVHRSPSNESRTVLFFVFRGMPFALHPAAGLLVQTKTGQELLANYLRNPQQGPAEEQFWHALSVAVYYYQGLRDDEKQDRKRG
jgi:hypothetical protein